MKRTLVVTALLAVGLTACQENPVSGRRQLALVTRGDISAVFRRRRLTRRRERGRRQKG